MKRFSLIVAAMAFSSSAFAVGVDSHAYNCAELQALIETGPSDAEMERAAALFLTPTRSNWI